jgi:DNA replicative helicase MCM subunit Mcm2 (Cdc46/Mcm family)
MSFFYNAYFTNFYKYDVYQVVDYAIARKIVDLHSNIENTVTKVYSREEVLRYITFARQFKPLISEVNLCIINCELT